MIPSGAIRITAITSAITSAIIRTIILWAGLIPGLPSFAQTALNVENPYQEAFRPQLHFSPREHWMNDPNGMVFVHGAYHLFFQYYPHGTTWGPMHWGHAISKDLVHWRQMPIALYPDSLGYIFSGSAVVDSGNTSGFGDKEHDGGNAGRKRKIPLVAIFTQHDPLGERHGDINFQNQSIAYSLDDGQTWVKYKNNPVLRNPGIKDFRDPKVIWYAPDKKWVMVLATKDRITFYSSRNLKNWQKESEFGSDRGAHGGVWECPDLFPLRLGDEGSSNAKSSGKTYWVLMVSINPGGPNGGSGTQYFIGQFDGHRFVPVDDQANKTNKANNANITKWIDYGPDDYAGVTWSNTGSRRIFLGWMSNWVYANEVPTQSWRSAMTIPRELGLRRSGDDEILLSSRPVGEMNTLKSGFDSLAGHFLQMGQYMASFEGDPAKDFAIDMHNENNEHVLVGFDKTANQYYIDRTRSGDTVFHKGFAARLVAPRFSKEKKIRFTLVVDAASLELFADDGLTVMTAIFFPKKPLTAISFVPRGPGAVKELSYWPLRSIW
jgi:fructan beta-fructosidase